MTRIWRLLAMAALLTVTTGAAIASAQTVYVRNAKPGEKVEVVLNATTAGTATADASGEVKMPLDLSATGKPELDANVYLDSCDGARRVLLVQRGTAPPPPTPGANCSRRDIQGVFWIRSINTIVVNFSLDANPSLLLVKGDYTPKDATEAESGGAPKRQAPTGLSLFGGGAFSSFADSAGVQCGNVTGCSSSGKGFGFTVGGTYWINRYLGVEGAYLKPKQVTASGSGTGYKFDTTQKTDVVTVMGKFGGNAGIVRVYGQAGVNYQQETTTTSETIDPVTITIEDTQVTIPNGTQVIEQKTDGWGYVFGGGMEIWATPSLALYAEGNYAKIKGDPTGALPVSGKYDDTLTYVTVGARFRLGGRSKKP